MIVSLTAESQDIMIKLNLIEVNSEVGAGTRGTRLASEALKTVGFELENNFFQKHNIKTVECFNEALYANDSKSPAKNSKAVLKTCTGVASAVSNSLKEEFFPFIIAGDHSSAAGTIAGIKLAHPEKRLGIIWVDAHADLQTPYTSDTGNMHGMPLAIASSEDNAEMTVNDLTENLKEDWDRLKTISGKEPDIQISDIVFIGARDIDKAERSLMTKHKVKNFTVNEVRQSDAKTIVNQTYQLLSECEIIYLSFDVDSMDPSVSVGTGTPVPEGLTEDEAFDLLKELVRNEKLICSEIVEVNPTLDTKNKMAKTVFPMMEEIAEIIENKNTDAN